MCFHSMSASDMASATAPGFEVEQTIALVSDRASQSLFRMLFSQQRVARETSAQEHCEVVSLLQGLASAVASSRSEISEIKDRYQHPPAPVLQPQLFPPFIVAESRSSSALSLDVSSDSSDVVQGGPLPCPFCPATHFSEKVHVQHMNRVLCR